MYEKLKRKTIVPNIQQQQQNYNPIPTASSVITSVSRMVKHKIFIPFSFYKNCLVLEGNLCCC